MFTLSTENYLPCQGIRHQSLILVRDLQPEVLFALRYARIIADCAQAIHIETDAEQKKDLLHSWRLYARGVPLQIVPSPEKTVVDPLLRYIKRIQEHDPLTVITVIIPKIYREQPPRNRINSSLRQYLNCYNGVIATEVWNFLSPNQA